MFQSSGGGSLAEWFSGAGMARMGAGRKWKVSFANDISPLKCAAYRENFGSGHLVERDIAEIEPTDVPPVDVDWASSPCQDLSLAGNGKGLGDAAGELSRSAAFYWYAALLHDRRALGRGPAVACFENVIGTLSRNNGREFATICQAYHDAGFRFGAIVTDAVDFLPQSRPRVVLVAVDRALVRGIPPGAGIAPDPRWHSKALLLAYHRLPDDLKADWIWWTPPIPMGRRPTLIDILEKQPRGVEWDSDDYTKRLVSLMAGHSALRLRQAIAYGGRHVGTAYRRTRKDEDGVGQQRVEIRFDGVAWRIDRLPTAGESIHTLQRNAVPGHHACFPRVGIK